MKHAIPGKSQGPSAPAAKPGGKFRPRRPPRRAHPSFGDICEMSGGLAVVWRERGCTEREMLEFVNDDPFVLGEVVPAMHALGFSEEDVIRHVPHDGPLAFLALWLSRLFMARGHAVRGSGMLALPPYVLASFMRRALTRRIAAMKNKMSRNIHYEAEKVRRRAMAAERRRVARRITTNPCPSAEELLEAWRHVRDSKESLVRFGSMMQDLECYVDNSLRFDPSGRIVGRNAGVKGWLRENLPEIAEHYTSAMRYKAAAKKLRQIVGLMDPTPVATVLGDGAGQQERAGSDGAAAGGKAERGAQGKGMPCNHGAEKSYRTGEGGEVDNANGTAGVCGGRLDGSPPVEVVRARAIYLEAMEGVPDVAARVMARIDALCDPERTDEAATLRGWREKYANAITLRRKDTWWRRLSAG